jgi:hypothetical protein
MSALLDFANWVKAAGPSGAPKRGPAAADRKAFEETLAHLEKVVQLINGMKETIGKMQASMLAKRHTDPDGFAREFTKYKNALEGMKQQTEWTLSGVESKRKELAGKGVDTSRFDPLVQKVKDLKDFAVYWLEPDPLAKLLTP